MGLTNNQARLLVERLVSFGMAHEVQGGQYATTVGSFMSLDQYLRVMIIRSVWKEHDLLRNHLGTSTRWPPNGRPLGDLIKKTP